MALIWWTVALAAASVEGAHLAGHRRTPALAAASVEGSIPHYYINLNLPPRERWKHVYKENKEVMREHIGDLRGFLDGYDQRQLDELVKATTISEEHREELHGIVEELGLIGLDMRVLILRQMRYELGLTQKFVDGCAGILMAMPNGTVLHGRNLDLPGNREELLSNLRWYTFLKDNKPFMKGLGHLGVIGLHNGFRYGGWSYEQNTRFADDGWTRGMYMDSIIREARKGAVPFMLEARTRLQEVATYGDALENYRTRKMMTGMYHILAGMGRYEGAVITVDTMDTKNQGKAISYSTRTMSKQDWYLVQTNDDYKGRPIDNRRKAADSYMAWRGRMYNMPEPKQGKTAMEKAMRVAPVCNEHTLYTWYMSVATGMDYYISRPCKPSETSVFRVPMGADELPPEGLARDPELPDVTPLFDRNVTGYMW